MPKRAATAVAPQFMQFDLSDPSVLAGLLLGGVLPFYFSAIFMTAVSKAAQSVILMAIVIGLTAIQFRFIERRVHYA